MGKRCSYIFEKSDPVQKQLFVDAYFKKHSNWCRYVNGAKTEEQLKTVNMEVYQYGGKLWYRTNKDVKQGQELIIGYGEEYWTDSEDAESDDMSIDECAIGSDN